jgi:RNA polymerase sigma factor (sigma-70 family)
MESDTNLLDTLKRKENAGYEQLYKSCFPSVAHYITRNNGSTQDAEDIFQEAILILLAKLEEPSFALTASIKTYLFAVSKNLWLKKLRSSRQQQPLDAIQNLEVEPEDETLNAERVNHWLHNMMARCQQVLKAIFYLNEPMDSVMKKMGWKNKHSAANQKYKCLEQLKRESQREPNPGN